MGVRLTTFAQILEGTYDMNNITNPYTKKLLAHLSQPLGIKDIPLQKEEDYICGWKKAKEKTSSSPSGIHFGHYIVGIEELVMAKINWLMATIPMLTGISPTWWRTMLNVVLEKLARNRWVEKL